MQKTRKKQHVIQRLNGGGEDYAAVKAAAAEPKFVLGPVASATDSRGISSFFPPVAEYVGGGNGDVADCRARTPFAQPPTNDYSQGGSSAGRLVEAAGGRQVFVPKLNLDHLSTD